MLKKKIYIPLLNEGVPVIRPTFGILVKRNIYKVLPTPDYDPENEEWEYPPGSIVICKFLIQDGKKILVAIDKV